MQDPLSQLRAHAGLQRPVSPPRVFLLSPANCGGERASLLFAAGGIVRPRPAAAGEPRGVALGEVFSFLSSLYFRGKLAYAERFGVPLVITPMPGCGRPTTASPSPTLRASARVDIHAGNARYLRPLLASARAVAATLGPEAPVTLLGSIASDKYVAALLEVFGPRLTFPAAFVGRGDMSRGGLLLRAVRAGAELDYVPVAGAVRRGARPPAARTGTLMARARATRDRHPATRRRRRGARPGHRRSPSPPPAATWSWTWEAAGCG